MSRRTASGPPDAGVAGSLPVLDRLAPPPPVAVVTERIERDTSAGDVVLDLHGRGGWIARAAIDRERRSVSLEADPLSRLLAELVLRPPDVRHLDAAFQALAASPRGGGSLREAVEELFASRCPTCGRHLVLDEVAWRTSPTGVSEPAGKHYRCAVCRDQQGGSETRQASVDEADVARAQPSSEAAAVRGRLRQRFPLPDGAIALVDELLALHTDRQLVALAWILERIEGELRAEPIEAALRLAFVHAIGPSSRLGGTRSRPPTPRVVGGRLRLPTQTTWRERNPWLAMEDGMGAVRSFVQRLAAGTATSSRAATASPWPVAAGGTASPLPVQARFGDDLRDLADGPTTAVVRTLTEVSARIFAQEAADVARRDLKPRVALAIGQPPPRPTTGRVALALLATGWGLGRDAAAMLPLDALVTPVATSWDHQSAEVRRSLEAAEPLMARDGRAVILLEESGPEAFVASVLGAAGAGYRLVEARPSDGPGPGAGGSLELVPPGASLPPGPRTRANVPLAPVPGGAGDPDLVPGRGLFAGPERVDARPFSSIDAARIVSDIAVEVLKARGEPAAFDRLLAEVLVGLDRAGQLRRFLAAAGDGHDADDGTGEPGVVERLVELVRGELTRTGHRRLTELEPGRWWLADRDDRLSAETPLADRVEWAVYSLLSTSTSISEGAFVERVSGLFRGYDVPDESLVRACLESYRSPDSTPDRLRTTESLVARSAEQTELLGALVDGARALGLDVALGRREQARRIDGVPLGLRLTDRERSVHLPAVARGAVDALEAVAAIWYARGRMAFLFEVEWTAMLGDLLLRRHARIPPDERVVRFLVVPPERTELVRHKLDRSPLLRTAMGDGNWHVLKWSHLRRFLAADRPALDDLEPLLGLDPPVERSGEQLPLFVEGRYA